ncbi:MAG: DUF3179 domain-containing protein, partial [Actinobacteria bacterium]|nr:DUF3179 domain-containing protein [Actinomycetota bacterium]
MAGLAWALAGGDGPATGDRAGDGATGPATTAPPGDEGADAEAPDDGWPSPLVDPDDIISGGPPPDGIPPIDDPAFLDPGSVDFLAEREPVLSVEHGGEAKAYPLRILMWHEIVNDEIGGEPVTVTYCPLCNTGIAFLRPTIDGELLDFGTSGKLYFSNLVMYDRQTDTLWVQAQGLAVVGPLTGTQLEFLPAQIVSWADWRAAHPDGKVLSQDTGFDRQYGANPYFDYDDPDIDRRPFLFTGEPDPRLPATSHVLGLNLDGDAVAFPYDALADAATGGGTVVETDVGGR